MITPRPIQAEAVRKARVALRKDKRALIVLATALGKTITSALVWKCFIKGRGLFLVHTNGILEGALEEYRRVFGSKVKLALYNGRTKDIEGADIVFATFQSMTRNLKRFPRSYFQWMTVDETHHAHAESYRKVIDHFQCLRLGITATPDRTDLQDIRELFGQEVVNISLEEAIARNLLPKIEYHLLTDDGFDETAFEKIIQEVLQEGKRLSLAEINRRVFIRARDKRVGEIIEGYGEKTVIFCRNISHAEHFKRFLKSAEVYHSEQHDDKNRQVLANLRNGITRRVLAVNAFNEGINVPDVGLVVFYRSTESETIFKQQLGRGLRPTKDKLIVLDFVGNLHRVQRLKQMADEVAEAHERFTTESERAREGYIRDRVHVSGKGFEFTFADQVVDLMRVIDRVSVEPYPTWQEAQKSAIRLGLNSQRSYYNGYRVDPRLPSSPEQIYPDFPGYTIFLGKRPRKVYSTWQKAGAVARKLGIRGAEQYKKEWNRDGGLPSNPNVTYPDFPGYPIFLGKTVQSFYSTWPQATKAILALGINTQQEYYQMYKKDPRLPSNPKYFYQDFPGWSKYLRGKKERKSPAWKEFYPSLHKCQSAVKKLGIRTVAEYIERRKEDPMLPSASQLVRLFRNFPGWIKFLGKK